MKLNKQAMARRDRVETGLITGTTARNRLNLVLLRCRQAVERFPSLADLLLPAIDDLNSIQSEVSEMKSILQVLWAEGEDRRWEEPGG